ncbi:uncharacterized protein FFNC_02430 [Fusarium fujikuroi]|nr:uncharacterized protein FFNC_02430 [Fusarium fujikuroi]
MLFSLMRPNSPTPGLSQAAAIFEHGNMLMPQ